MEVRMGLDLKHVPLLARAFTEGDLVECGAVGLTPYATLMYGRDAGAVWTVFPGMDFEQDPVGCGGYSRIDRSIWCYFARLGPDQHRDLMRKAPGWIAKMVQQAGDGYPLHNCIYECNYAAIRWLKATHCFNFLDSAIRVGPHRFLQFEAKPYAELAALTEVPPLNV
jgi:hypothetical protein